MLHPGIHDRYDLYSLFCKSFDYFLWIWKTVLIPGKDPVTLHVIDIEVYHVERQVTLPILSYHLVNHCFRVITTANLLVPHCPHLREWHSSCEISVTPQNFRNRWSIEKVVVHLAAFGAKPASLLRGFTEIEIAPVAVVEEDPVGDAIFQTEVKRHGLVDRITSFYVTRRIRIPVDE